MALAWGHNSSLQYRLKPVMTTQAGSYNSSLRSRLNTAVTTCGFDDQAYSNDPSVRSRLKPGFTTQHCGDKARLDISARGVWSTFEKTFFDVRIFNAKPLSYKSKTLPGSYTSIQPAREEEKPVYESCVTIGERITRPPYLYNNWRNCA